MRRAPLPATLTDPGPCTCDAPAPRGRGTAQAVAHVGRRWCPTVTGAELVDGAG